MPYFYYDPTFVLMIPVITSYSIHYTKLYDGSEEPIDCRPADLLKPELNKLREECAEWIEQVV